MKSSFVNPNKNAITLLGFPLYMLILLALLLPKRETATAEDLQDRDSLLGELLWAMPIPRNRLHRWVITKVVEWIYLERGAVWTLRQVCVSEMGWLPK